MQSRTLLQFFHWYYPEGGKLWSDIAGEAQRLSELGITDCWLPPADVPDVPPENSSSRWPKFGEQLTPPPERHARLSSLSFPHRP